MIKIAKKHKRLYEEGEQAPQNTTATNAAPQNQAPVQQNQTAPQNSQPQQQNVQQQNQQNTTNQQPATNNNQAQNNQEQQNNNQQQQQVDPNQQDLSNKVSTFMSAFQERWDKNDIFWALSYDLPDELVAVVPEFKQDNPNAKPAIDAWANFKKNPTKELFGTFIEELGKFGKGPETEGNSLDAIKNSAQQNAQNQQQEAVNNNQSNESLSMSFGERLQQRLLEETNSDYIHKLVEDGFYKLN